MFLRLSPLVVGIEMAGVPCVENKALKTLKLSLTASSSPPATRPIAKAFVIITSLGPQEPGSAGTGSKSDPRLFVFGIALVKGPLSLYDFSLLDTPLWLHFLLDESGLDNTWPWSRGASEEEAGGLLALRRAS